MKLLVLDIENSFLLTAAWSLWDNFTPLERLLDNGKILCWACKWVGDKEMMYSKHDAADFLTRLHALLDQADGVLTYNGTKHDIPLINREFLKAGLGPPSPYKHVDLYATVKRAFKFPSNKMQHLVTELELGTKLDHEGFELWVKCLKDDPKAWKTMEKYNKMDVTLLEKLYKKMLPWIAAHPNLSLLTQSTVCPHCGSKHLQSRGYYHGNTQTYRKFKCMNMKCGKWSRTRYTEIDKDVRKKLLVGIS